ncbi:Glycosyltransferase involved in cell wall bisynthesis [Blastococcus fimeti]|nr:Glycosyltransferase involved in cell wall bisynthesis [Blastococcus fimeti]
MDEAPLRVALVGPPLSASGGIGRVMSYVLAGLRPGDVDVEVLDTRGTSTHPVRSLLPLLRSCARLLLLGFRRGVDVVHVNISSHGSALRKGLVVRTCRLAGLPVVLHLHASSFPEFYAPLPALAQRWVRRTFDLAVRVVVLSETWRDYVQEELGVRPELVTVLPNAAPGSAVPAPARRPGEELRFLFLGRLGPRKGAPELLDALADPRLGRHAWRATLAGDGDVATYRARAADHGLTGRTAFPGWIAPDAVDGLLADAHVLVLPSHAEGMPMSVLEAFAAGVPVVCTPVGGLAEVVVDGENGLLVPPGDVDALAGALARVLDDEPLRRRLAAGARETWQSAHAIDGYRVRLLAEWRAASSGRGPRGPLPSGSGPTRFPNHSCTDRQGTSVPAGSRE